MSRVLTADAEADRDSFMDNFGDGGCTCFISPPCGYCTHPGNPRNQEEDESCWTWETMADMLDGLERDAREAVAATIETAAARHLSQMKEGALCLTC